VGCDIILFMKMHELGGERNYKEIIDLMESMLKIFPNNSGLMSCLGTTLALTGDETRRAIQLCEHALKECTSYKGRGTIYATLCFLYQQSGNTEKAEELARSLPHARESRELLLPNFLKQPDKDAYLRENLPGILSTICMLIDGSGEGTDDVEQLRSIMFGTYGMLIDPMDATKKIAEFFSECN